MKLNPHQAVPPTSFSTLWKTTLLALSFSLSAHAQATIQLPIEVMPVAAPQSGDAYPYTPPTTASQSVSIPVLSGIQASLWMKVHGSSYASKMSVSINNSTPIAITNTTTGLTIPDPERSYGGIGSNYPVIEMTLTLPSNWNQSGANTIQFYFNGTDGNSCGFRVIAFNILDGSGNQLIPAADFTYDDPNPTTDPANWASPLNDTADINAGKALYQGQAYNGVAAPALKASPLAGAATLTASCAACHTLDGHDLKYFNYSNYSIEARSQFHGLTPTQGLQIASYIRSLAFVNPGRPWNPPYQPTTAIDTQPVTSWAAGGGLDAVLPTDFTALNYVFPNGISPNANSISTSQNLNARTTPTEFMLLDWNHWLPRVHPLDATALNTAATTAGESTFLNSSANHYYNGEGSGTSSVVLMSYLSTNLTTNLNSGTVYRMLSNWFGANEAFLRPIGTTNPPGGWTPTLAGQVYAELQWKQVKMWDVMTTFGLEGQGQYFFGGTATAPATSVERATWPTGEAFQVAPARQFIPGTVNNFTTSLADYEYLDNAWYELEFVLDAGNRLRKGNDPIDWPYIRGRVTGVQLYSENPQLPQGWPEVTRMVMMLVKGMQQNDGVNHLAPSDTSNGWEPRNTGNISMLVSPSYANLWSGITAAQKRQVLNAITKVWFAKIQQYTVAQYYQDYTPDDGPVGPLYVTQPDGSQLKTNAWATEVQDGNMNGGPFLDQVYCMIPFMRTAGVDPQLLNNICAWGATVWPASGNHWSSLATTIANSDLATVNLVGRWTFDEGFGTNVVDWSDAGANTGVLQGTTLPAWISSTTPPTTGSSQKVGYGDLALTSANANQISVANWPNLTQGSAMTISAWIKSNVNTGPATPVIMIANTKTSATSAAGFQFYYNPRNATLDLIGGGSAIAVTSIGTLDTGWHHFVATVNGTAVALYFDDVSKTLVTGHTTVGAITASANPLVLGAGLDGQLDDVRVYNSALGSGDITTLHNVTQ